VSFAESASAPARPPLTIGPVTVPPGQRQQVELPVARLPTGTMMALPVTVIHGKRPGPRLWLSAAIHGDELNGVEIIRRVSAALKSTHLRGAVVAVPVVNLFGLLGQSRYLPDRRDLNRSFPGSPRGSLGARLAHIFMQGVVHQCTHGIDLHTGAVHRANLPQVRANLDDPATYAVARAFAAPIMIHAATRDGSLRQAAARRAIPVLVYEGGEALRFDETAIQAGVRGIVQVLHHLQMYPLADPPTAAPVLESRHTRWLRASRSGLWQPQVGLGETVAPRQRLGLITDTFGRRPLTVRSPGPGLVVGLHQNPLVNQGDALVHVATLGTAPPAPLPP